MKPRAAPAQLPLLDLSAGGVAPVRHDFWAGREDEREDYIRAQEAAADPWELPARSEDE